MIRLKDHLFPRTPEEAVEMLDRLEGRGRILAGGTDLVERLREGKPGIDVFVDVARIDGFKSVHREKEWIVMEGGVTHAQAGASDLIRQDATVLAEACTSVGGPQIRNLGTLAGNVVSAQPAADGSLALLALGAVLTVVRAGCSRQVDITEAFGGVGLSTIDATREIITAIRIPAANRGRGSNYQRLAMRRALSLPMLAVAAVVGLEDGSFSSTRVAVGPIAEVPLLVESVDDMLREKPVTPDIIEKASRLVADTAKPRDSRLRGSGEYRRSMVKVLACKAISAAAQRAQNGI
jgi:carbon-monoxide dehydrogenase medium subunit